MSIRKIVEALKRSPSTISKEIKRNYIRNDNQSKELYFPNDADDKYNERRLKCHRPRKINSEIKEYIQEKILAYWSPEQISNRKPSTDLKIPSTATIYRLIHRNEIKQVSMKNLRRKGNFKRPSERRGKFNDGGRIIDKRGKEVYKRKESGHWEIEEALCCKTYFCEAYCAWQKGRNKNTNGLLREFYPKGMDLSAMDEEELASNIDLMNNKPRKCLGYKTPNEVLFNYLH